MLLTEEEAKKKVCPFGILPSALALDYEIALCAASGCVMWRIGAKDMNGIHGYCGLAGKPE